MSQVVLVASAELERMVWVGKGWVGCPPSEGLLGLLGLWLRHLVESVRMGLVESVRMGLVESAQKEPAGLVELEGLVE